VGKQSGINIIKPKKKSSNKVINDNKQTGNQTNSNNQDKSFSRDLGNPVVLFVAWQPLRVFRTSYEAAAMLLFVIKIGEIKVRNHSKYLLTHLFF